MGSTDNRGSEVRAVAATMFVLALVSVLLRFFVRLRIIKALGTDDWYMLLAMISFALNTSTCLAGVTHGTGQHSSSLSLSDMSAAMMFWWYCYLSYCTSMIFSKTSVACFLLRLTPLKPQRITIYIALAVSIFISTAFFFIALFQCWPVSFFWTRAPGTGSCISIDVIISITYAYSVFAIITDFAFTILPIWLVKDLQVDRRTKLALIPILCMAAVASCAVAVRLGYVKDFRNTDFLWSTTDIAIWSQIEQGLAITAGSLPTLQPLFRKFTAKLGLTSAGSCGGVSARPANGLSHSHKFENANSKVSSRTVQISLHSFTSGSKISGMSDAYSCSTEELRSVDCNRQLTSSHSKSDDIV